MEKKTTNHFPVVALQCMPTLQLPADEKSWFTLLLKEKKKEKDCLNYL